MAGRPTKPTALRELEGDRSKRPPKVNEPKPTKGAPTPPKSLKGEALAEWRRVVPELDKIGMLATVDRSALVQYCRTWARLQDCHEDMEANGCWVENARGLRAANPAMKMQVALSGTLIRFLTEFGLTPAARARMAIQPKSADEKPTQDPAAKAAAKWGT